MSDPVVITFLLYLVCLLGIGVYFWRRSAGIEDYLLGGRSMGAAVTALSAQASDMSGWLLMGLPGAIYIGGMGNSWIAIGLLIGTICNWHFVAARLRVYTERTGAITLPCFFEERFKDPTGLLRTVSAIIILIFFTIYASSGLVAAGKLFNSIFDVNYYTAVIIGGGVIILYTFLGGFLAVCWTDLFQGLLMIAAIVIVPWIALSQAGGTDAIAANMKSRELSASLFDTGHRHAVLGILSTMAWGLGYFGQPHILTRFMSVKSLKVLRMSKLIAIAWVVVALPGALFIGYVGIGLFGELNAGDEEKVFIFMIDAVCNPWAAGVMLAAILSAIMSTIDSQLLVSSSALTEDFYQKVIKRDASEKETLMIGRICVLIISAIAMVLAMDEESSILGIVAYAWGGFGAAFGPLVLFSLFSKNTTWKSALAGMVVGTVVLVVWERIGYGDWIYEIVPGFAANCLVIFAVNAFCKQNDEAIFESYENVMKEIL